MFLPAMPARNPAIGVIRGEQIFSESECDEIPRSGDRQGWQEGRIGSTGAGTVAATVRSVLEQRLPDDQASGFPLVRIITEISRLNSELWYFNLPGFRPADEARLMPYPGTAAHC